MKDECRINYSKQCRMAEVVYSKIKQYLRGLTSEQKQKQIRLSTGVVIVDVEKLIKSHTHKLDYIKDKSKKHKGKHIVYYERLLKVYQYFKNEEESVHTEAQETL